MPRTFRKVRSMAETFGPWNRSPVAAATRSMTSRGCESTVRIPSSRPVVRSTRAAARHSGMVEMHSSIVLLRSPMGGPSFLRGLQPAGRRGRGPHRSLEPSQEGDLLFRLHPGGFDLPDLGQRLAGAGPGPDLLRREHRTGAAVTGSAVVGHGLAPPHPVLDFLGERQ